jgi:uroporphyrinogen decarboxylase
MTRRERVIAALNHVQTDFAPYQIHYSYLERRRLEAALGKDFDADWRYHIHAYQYGYSDTTGLPEGCRRDECGAVWRDSVIENPVIGDIEDNNFVFPPVDAARLRRDVESFLSKKEDMFTVIGGCPVFERAWSLCGMDNVLVAMLAAPEALGKLLADICADNATVMDIMLEYDFDAFYFGDDWGAQRGLIMGREHWRRFIKPVLVKLYQKAKAKGRFIIQHSCGDIGHLFGDLIEIGLDCYQTFQPEIYDIAKIKAAYGGKLTFWGGVSTQRLLACASAQEVEARTRETLKIMAKGGGYILSPTHAVPHDVPPENILALYRVMSNQG